MTARLELTDSAIFTAMRAFLTDVLPSGDARFSGGIAGTTLTVTELTRGTIAEGDLLFGENVVPGTRIGPNIDADTWTVSPSQDIETAYFSTGIEVVQGQVNRVPEVRSSDYVVMTPPERRRIGTNAEDDNDVVFTGAIADDVMTVSEIIAGVILLNTTVFGVDVSAGTKILRQLTGAPGGVGTYKVSPSQTVDSEKMSSGARVLVEATEIIIQLDVHGPQGGDTSQIITTTFRDGYGVEFFAALDIDLSPLYADDALQVPFPNQEAQWENRWVIRAHLQANPRVSVAQQFADTAEVEVISVQAEYAV